MSIRDYLDNSLNLNFQNIDCNNLMVNKINGSTGATGQTGPTLILTSSDNSINITGSSGQYDLTGAGSNWSNFTANNAIQFIGFPIINANSINFANHTGGSINYSLYQDTGGLFISDNNNNIGQVYDSHFNPPLASSLSSILTSSSDAGNIGITGVNSLSCKSLVINGNTYSPNPTPYTLYNHDVAITNQNIGSSWNGQDGFYILSILSLNLPSDSIYELKFNLQSLTLHFSNAYTNNTVNTLYLGIISNNPTTPPLFPCPPYYYSAPIQTTAISNATSVNFSSSSSAYLLQVDTPLTQTNGVSVILYSTNASLMYPITSFDLQATIQYSNVIIKSA
jgi:hypothetical protein